MNGEDNDLQQFYHVTVILDFEYTAESEEHARTLAANHISTSLRLGTTTSRRIRIKPLELSAASGVPFYRQIVDQVAGLIRSGRLAPGTQLPPFRDLAPQVRVSLITVRRAYADLEQAGLIVKRQGQGTFVAEEVGSASRELALEEARTGLATAVTRARQLGLTGEDLRAHLESLLVDDGEEGGENRDDE